MESVLLLIHLFLALAIIGLVLLQRSEGGGLGIGGGGGGLGDVASGKATANALTKATAICAGLFFCTSLVLGILAGHSSDVRQGILKSMSEENVPAIEAPLEAPIDEPVSAPEAPLE